VISQWVENTLNKLEQKGVARSQMIIDPGIGFGKTAAQSLTLIKNAAQLKKHEVDILIGHSRKSFLSQFTKGEPELRDSATLAVSSFLMTQKIDYLRVHDVEAHAMLQRIHGQL
jgi:dihydropteroate synthase